MGMKYLLTVAACVLMCVIPVSGQTQIDLMRYEGVTRPAQQVQLSAPVDGIVDKVLVKEGQFIKADQPLLQMDDAVQRLATASSQLQAESTAQIERAQYALEEATIMLDRAQQSYDNDAASEWEVRRMRVQRDQAKADAKLAEDNHKIAQKRYELELERLDRYRLDAPFDGVVLRRTVEPGETVRTEDKLLAIVSVSPIRAEIHLPAVVYGEMTVGSTYELIGSAPAPERLKGRLTVVDALIDPASQTFRCVFEVSNPDGKMPAGFVVRLASLRPVGG